jgi:formyl-CoA transferase
MEGVLPEYSLTGAIREPMGSGMTSSAPTSAYRCKGGAWVLIAANSDPLFRTLAAAMGRPELAEDPRFSDNPSRLRNVAELDRLIGHWTETRSIDEVLELLEASNIPSSKVYTVADIAADEQYRHRRMVTEFRDAALGPLLHPGVVPLVQGLDRDAQIRWAGPEVGEHNAEVYGGLLGLSPAAVRDLQRRGVI